MQAVFLDFDTLGPDDIDPAPLTNILPGLKLRGLTPAQQVADRISAAEVVIANKTATTLLVVGAQAVERVAKRRDVEDIANKKPAAVEGDGGSTLAKNGRIGIVAHTHAKVRNPVV